MFPTALTRRQCLHSAAQVATGAALWPHLASSPQALAQAATGPKSVAAVVTVYFHGSHADVILGKILEGWQQDGGPGPALKLASVYIDQFPNTDIGRAACEKHGVPIFNSIAGAVTAGTNGIPVDAVLSIGEHGSYPLNAIGQQMYPRRKFFAEIAATFEKYGRVVPVFNDKHLGPVWEDARWMYDRARELRIPFMAGSSLPVGFRRSEIKLPQDCDIEAAVGIGYSGLEIYGIHALEFLQYHLERRRGAERGVRSVQFLEGEKLWQAVDSGLVNRPALEAAFAAVPKSGQPDMRQDSRAGLFLFEYEDGVTGAVLMLSCVNGVSIGVKLRGEPQAVSTAFDERTMPRHPHFAYLLKAIERMVYTQQPTYPVERTLLTSGILDRVLRSRAEGGRKLMTPELSIAYRPVAYPHAPHVDLMAPPPGRG